MKRNLVGSTYGRCCIKFPRSRMKGERQALPLLVCISMILDIQEYKESILQVNFFSHWLKVLHLENLLFILNQDPPNRNNNSSQYFHVSNCMQHQCLVQKLDYKLKNTTFGMEHSYFNLMLYLFQEDCKQPEGYKVGLLNIHMIQDKTIQRTISHSFTHNS